MIKNITLLTFILFLTPRLIYAEDAERINRVFWVEDKEHNTWRGKINDEWAVAASSKNEIGVCEMQVVTCPGTHQKITIFTEIDEETKKFRHSINIPKNYPFPTQIRPSKKTGGVVVTITFKDKSFWILFTDPDRNLIGINNFPWGDQPNTN